MQQISSSNQGRSGHVGTGGQSPSGGSNMMSGSDTEGKIVLSLTGSERDAIIKQYGFK